MIFRRGRRLKVPHQILQRPHGVGILHQLLLELLDLRHELPGLRLLRHLQQYRLGGGRDDHLRLLAEHLDPLAAEAGTRVVTVTQLAAQGIEFALEWGEIDRAGHREKA